MAKDKQNIAGTSETERLEENICIHIFSVSAAMVGACATLIGIIQVVIKAQNATTLIDDLIAFNALLFLTSCVLSYWAMRKQGTTRMFRIENIADTIFIIGLILMVLVCILIALEVTWIQPVTKLLR